MRRPIGVKLAVLLFVLLSFKLSFDPSSTKPK